MARQTHKQIRRIRRGTGWASALIVALLALYATPAFAHHKSDHAQGGGNDKANGHSQSDHDGDADSDPNTSFTEDNDTNDGGTPNNVEDDGDNAHPSGKDRSVENDGSGNQGKAESDPDDDGRGPDRSNGGPDKPNGSGGVDKADQDGNNGCGNDDDFEDDNEGWCGKPDRGGNGGNGGGNDTVAGGGVDRGGDVGEIIDQVEGETESKGSVRGRIHQARPGGTSVLGSVTRAAESAVGAVKGAVLPFTGANMLIYLAAGLGLILLGAVTLVLRAQAAGKTTR